MAGAGRSANLRQAGWRICPWHTCQRLCRAPRWGPGPDVGEAARKPQLHLSPCRVSVGPNFISVLAGCELFQVIEVLFCQRLGLRGFSVFDSICCGARVRCRVEMEEENYLRMILSSSPPPFAWHSLSK